MEIGNDDIDFIEDDLGPTSVNDITTQDNDNQIPDDDPLDNPSSPDDNHTEPSNPESNNDDFITSLLKSRGIEDKSKIKFENDEGETEEVDWDSLDNETKLNILNSSVGDNNTDLDDAEMQLINAVRRSQLSPAEFIQYMQQQGVNQYLQNAQADNYVYKVNELSDDELFVTDFMARTGVTEEEAFDALDRVKANETLFKKQMGAIRAEYQKSEEETIRYNELRRQEEAQAQFDQFAEGVRDEISDFTEFAGCDLNMNNEDMQELYDFITGFDAAGNSYFGKALNHPATLVKMAWFALNGEKMIQDINEYYKKEIANVRKESYNKGVQASKDKPNVVHKNVSQNSNKPKSPTLYDDLDDF